MLAARQNYVATLRRSRNLWAVLFWPIVIMLAALPFVVRCAERAGGGRRIA